MELDKIFGLPAHPLLVHAPVLLVPLCAIGAIWIAWSPSWRHRIGWIVVVLAGGAVVASQLAAGSGEALQDALKDDSILIERHAELGNTFVWFALAFFLALLALMVWDTMQRRAAASAGADLGGRRPRSAPPGSIDHRDRARSGRHHHRRRGDLPRLSGGSLRGEVGVGARREPLRWVGLVRGRRLITGGVAPPRT